MLSNDELANGRTFILKLVNRAGVPSQWKTLRGDTARRWYTLYRNSDWPALCTEAAAVFTHAVGVEEAERIRKSARCVVIHAPPVTVEQLLPVEPL